MASPHRYAYGSPGGASHIPWGPRSAGAPGPPSPTRAAQAYAPHLPHSHSPSRPQSQQQQQQQQQQHEQRSQHSSPVRATFDMGSSGPQQYAEPPAQQQQQFRPQMQMRIQTHAEPQWPHERYPVPGSQQHFQQEYEAAADEQRYHVPSEFQEHRYAQHQQHQQHSQQAHGMQYHHPHHHQQQHQQQNWREPQQAPPSHDNHAYVPFPSTSGAGDVGMYSYDRDRAYEQGVLPLETLGLEPPPPVSPERRERKGSGASARSLLASSPFGGLFKRGRKGSAAAAAAELQREREESGLGQGQGYFDASNAAISASQSGAHTPTSPSPLGAGGACGEQGAGEREGERGREKRASPGAAFFAAARNAARSFSPASPASWGRRSGGEMALAGGSGGGDDGNGSGAGGRRSRKSSATRTPSPSSFVVHNVVKQPGGVSLDEYHASFGSEPQQQQQQVGNSGYRREKSRPLGGGSGGSGSGTGSGAGSLAAPPGGPGGGTGYGTARSGNDGRPETAIPAEFIMKQPTYQQQQHYQQQRGRSGGGASVRSRDSREQDHYDDDAARYDDERERSTSAAAAGEETMIVHHRPPSPGNISARAFRRNSTTFRSSSPSRLHSPVPPATAAAAVGSRDGRDKPLPPPGRLSPVPPQQESHEDALASPLQTQPPQPFAQPPSSQQQQQRRAMTGPRDSPFRQQSVPVPGASIAAQHGLPEPIPIPAAAADDQRAGLGMGRQRRSSGGGGGSEGRSPSGSAGGWRLRKGSGAGSSIAPDSPVGSSSPAGGRSAGLLSKILARENAANAQQHQQQQYGDVSLPDGASPRRGSRIASGASPAGLTGFLKGLLTPSTRAQDDSDDEGDFASPRLPHGAAPGGRRIVSPMPGRMGEETVLLDPSQLHAEAELQKRESVRQAQRIVDEERRRIMEAPTHGAHGHHAGGGGRQAESQPWQPRQALDHDPAHALPHQGAHAAHRSRKAVPRMSEPGIPADEEPRSRDTLDDPLAELDSKLTPAQRIILETRSRHMAQEQYENDAQVAERMRAEADAALSDVRAVVDRDDGERDEHAEMSADFAADAGGLRRDVSELPVRRRTRSPTKAPAQKEHSEASSHPPAPISTGLKPGEGPLPSEFSSLPAALQEMMIRFYRFERYSVPLLRDLETRLIDIERDAQMAINGDAMSVNTVRDREMDKWVGEMTSLMRHEIGQLQAATRELREGREILSVVANTVSSGGGAARMQPAAASADDEAQDGIAALPPSEAQAGHQERKNNISSASFNSTVPAPRAKDNALADQAAPANNLSLPAGAAPALDKDEGKAPASPTKLANADRRERSTSPSGRPRYTKALGEPMENGRISPSSQRLALENASESSFVAPSTTSHQLEGPSRAAAASPAISDVSNASGTGQRNRARSGVQDRIRSLVISRLSDTPKEESDGASFAHSRETSDVVVVETPALDVHTDPASPMLATAREASAYEHAKLASGTSRASDSTMPPAALQPRATSPLLGGRLSPTPDLGQRRLSNSPTFVPTETGSAITTSSRAAAGVKARAQAFLQAQEKARSTGEPPEPPSPSAWMSGSRLSSPVKRASSILQPLHAAPQLTAGSAELGSPSSFGGKKDTSPSLDGGSPRKNAIAAGSRLADRIAFFDA